MRVIIDQLKKRFVSRWIIAFIFIFWVSVQLFLLSRGVKTGVDSEVYISNARSILAGDTITGIDFWHIGYSYFLASIFWIGGNLLTVILSQIILSGLALIALFSLAYKLSGDKRVAVIASLLFVGWFKIHEWNTFIYSESLFTSCVLISLAILNRCTKPWHYLVCLPLFCFTFLIRPTGVGLLAGLVAYVLYELDARLEFSKKWFYIGATGVVVLFAYVLQLELTDYVNSILESYSKAEIIYPNIKLWITVPDDLWLPAESTAPYMKLLSFAWHNPLYFVKLFSLKFLLFFANLKPYFSWLHNLFIILILFPSYYFAVHGFKQLRSCGERYFMLVFIFFQALTVACTSENWDGRFLIPVLPMIFVLAGIGLNNRLRA